MDSSPCEAEPSLPPPMPAVASAKRPAPSLLPAFEPLSSSPGLPRPVKRLNTGTAASIHLKYPTPVPTSSTALPSSSPLPRLARGASDRRVPLSAVPTVELPENGEAVAMGRSSNSSQFQLSSNRLVSRVHLTARYGRTWELYKGDSFTSETEGTDIMVDVLDARVMLQWPKLMSASASESSSSWDDTPPRLAHAASLLLQSSPLRRAAVRIASPESPTPLAASQRLQRLPVARAEREGAGAIEIYEDEPDLSPSERGGSESKPVDAAVSMRTEATTSFMSDAVDDDDDDPDDPDEENDPIIHSFGPFGADISGRLASISTKSPKSPAKQRRPLPAVAELVESPTPVADVSSPLSSPETTPPARPSIELDPSIINHVVNQLAFSRLSSTPLSTIMQHLPAEAKTGLERESLREAIEAESCIGIIHRQGKDAAGKPLESEYYYIPEQDGDEQRRAAVVDGLRRPSLRNCRKQHKQYYWKRPRTP
ncbi:hypothetical protein DCS_02443 [Drechmeria coniospora]|uniref:FHA domain-containing protein n=1 Tax=Drechmeria coniospora TaxID=98403 RepID=A0A151GW58_DRECN|nr:hypothetical protein DCS_02443 [Drechmeria coniospora]KYK61301.1 hypothetical protein DCS_02443 [Drechmeria coniospora]